MIGAVFPGLPMVIMFYLVGCICGQPGNPTMMWATPERTTRQEEAARTYWPAQSGPVGLPET